eukprot:10490094-Prorocentrum_lima.AAC.1
MEGVLCMGNALEQLQESFGRILKFHDCRRDLLRACIFCSTWNVDSAKEGTYFRSDSLGSPGSA